MKENDVITLENYEFTKAIKSYIRWEIDPVLKKHGFIKYYTHIRVRECNQLL